MMGALVIVEAISVLYITFFITGIWFRREKSDIELRAHVCYRSLIPRVYAPEFIHKHMDGVLLPAAWRIGPQSFSNEANSQNSFYSKPSPSTTYLINTLEP